PRQAFVARLAPGSAESDQKRRYRGRSPQAIQRQHLAPRQVPPAEGRRRAPHPRRSALLQLDGDGGSGSDQERQDDVHVHSPIWMVLFNASRTAASTACGVTLSQANLRALSRSEGCTPRTLATVPAPAVPPAQASAVSRTTTSQRSPRLPSEQVSSGATSSSVASVRSLGSRAEQVVASGRKPSRFTALTAKSLRCEEPLFFTTTPTTRRARASSSRPRSWLRSAT